MNTFILLQEPCSCGSEEGKYVEEENTFWIICHGCEEFVAEEKESPKGN